MTAQTDAAETTTRYQYGDDHQPEVITDALGFTTTFRYDARHLLTQTVNALGHTTFYSYTADGRLAVVTDVLGYTTTYGYVGLSQRPMTDAHGFTTTWHYDGLGRLLTTIDALGQMTVNEYDAAGHLLTVTETLVPGTLPDSETVRQTRFAYDEAGRQTYLTDTRGVVTLREYELAGQLVTVTLNYTRTPGLPANEYNLRTVYGYDKWGRREMVTDGLGRVRFTGYDELGRVACAIANYHGDLGCATEFDSALPDRNLITRHQYYPTQRMELTINPLGQRVIANYRDGIFNPNRPDEDLATTTGYDALGRPAE